MRQQSGQPPPTLAVVCHMHPCTRPCVPGSRKDNNKGAFAIVLSGGYEDDDDSGTQFWYTGEGGQAKGKQVGGGAG